MERAYASIEKGTVRLGNAWLERRWSSFLGTTTELILRPASTDCLIKKSPEFHVDYGGRPLAAMDLGDLTWSEAVDAHGASVSMELHGPGIAIQLETCVLHRCPGMVRRLAITNTSGESIPITRLAAEVLPLDPARYASRSVQGEAEFSAMTNGEPIHYVSLRGSTDAVLLGACRKARFALYQPNPAYCAPVWEGRVALEPGRTWSAPPVTLYWLPKAAAEDFSGAVTEFHRAWQARDAANGAMHPSHN